MIIGQCTIKCILSWYILERVYYNILYLNLFVLQQKQLKATKNQGSKIKLSTKVTLGISRGTPPDYYKVPNVLNFSIEKAKQKIISSGLRLGELTYEYQPQLLKNTVKSTDFEGL